MRRFLAALALLGLLAGGLAACAPAPVTAADGDVQRPPRPRVTLPQVQAASDTVTMALTTAGQSALAMPQFNEAQRANIMKALLALKTANQAVQNLRAVDGASAGMAIAAVAREAQGILPVLPLKPEVSLSVSAALVVLQIVAPLVPVPAPPAAPAATPAPATTPVAA